jgi:LPS export ABC transporter protein LptC
MIKKLTTYFIAGMLFTACGEEINKVKILLEPSNMPIEKGKNVEIIYSDSGRIKARVNAPIIERFDNGLKTETEMPAGIKVSFYNNTGSVESTLSANYAVRNDRTKAMTAKNDVVLTNVNGDTLKTELLNWDEYAQRIYTDQFVRISTKDEIIMGTGFESNPEFTKYKISQISGTISLKE